VWSPDGLLSRDQAQRSTTQNHETKLLPLRTAKAAIGYRSGHDAWPISDTRSYAGAVSGNYTRERNQALTPPFTSVALVVNPGLGALFAQGSSCGRSLPGSSKALVRHRRRSGGSDGQIGLQRVRSSTGLAGGAQLAATRCHSTVFLQLPLPMPAWLSRLLAAPSVAPACGWWIGGFGLEQSDAEELALLVDALDHVPVELELADDDGGKVNPTGAQLIERYWLPARLP
jgi:hypothetical protein